MAKVLLHKDLMDSMGRQAAVDLRTEFLEWLRVGEFNHELFGKDSAFDRPREAAAAELRHVHLVPVINLVKKAEWEAGKRRDPPSRTSSNRVLIYVRGMYDENTFLLIDLLPEDPDEARPGHDPKKLKSGGHALMRDYDLVRKYAATAERFRLKY